MAKKPVLPTPQLVHIQAISADAGTLSKAQKEFNRLTKRIAKLEKDVAGFREAATQLRQRVQTEYRPLETAHNDQLAALVRLLDHAYDTYKLTKGERTKAVDLLLNVSYDLIERGYVDLKSIFDKHEPQGFDEVDAEGDKQASELMKQLFSQQFGIEFDPAVDVSTQAKFQAYVAQQMAGRAAQSGQQEAQQTQAEPRSQRKKSPKQQAAEEKKQAEEKNITKAVRTLYMDLVKALHPDREPDEAEKDRKTELLKQVTTAYEASELLTLLRLQLELQRIDQTHLENLAEDQLRYYNTLLREQARELDEALYQEQQEMAAFSGRPYYFTPTPAALEHDYQEQKKQLVAKTKQLAAEVLAFEHDPAALKAFLKAYKIPKAGPEPMFGQF